MAARAYNEDVEPEDLGTGTTLQKHGKWSPPRYEADAATKEQNKHAGVIIDQVEIKEAEARALLLQKYEVLIDARCQAEDDYRSGMGTREEMQRKLMAAELAEKEMHARLYPKEWRDAAWESGMKSLKEKDAAAARDADARQAPARQAQVLAEERAQLRADLGSASKSH
jgi:hypothetical protein